MSTPMLLDIKHPEKRDAEAETGSAGRNACASNEVVAPKKLYIKSWGCQMNVYDSKRMADVLRPLGYTQTDAPDDADFVILNTCHIREKATEKVFSEIGRLKPHKKRRAAEGKETLFAVAGCVAQAEGDVITQRAKDVDLVFGPQNYHQLPEMLTKLQEARGQKRIVNTEFPVESKFDFLPVEETEKSGPVAHVAIQEGCDKFCTFCVVPYTRGAEFSRPAAQILQEIKNLVAAGAQEIQLVGQNVNAYHGDGVGSDEWDLGRLLFAVAELEGVKRIRYTTSHPRDMHDSLYQAHAEIPQLMPFLHLPVQSGSDAILKAMNRKHGAELYFDVIDKLRTARPDICFSSDFIVGFPGESDADFRATMDLIARVKFASAYSFKYSKRPGTPADALQNQIHESIKDARLQELQTLLFAQAQEFNNTFIGQTVPVLFERPGNKNGQVMGRAPHMQSVYAVGADALVGSICDVRITGASATALTGALIEATQQAA